MRNHYNRLIRVNELTDAQNLLNHSMQVDHNISRNKPIYFYHHSCGYPLARVLRCNHFGYLKPIQKPNIEIGLNSIKEIFSENS